jgi:hypothetical protein
MTESARTYLVEILYFRSCPHWLEAAETVRRVVEDAGLDEERIRLRIIAVETEEAAKSFRFLGSPTVRVDGQDVDPSAAEREDFGLQCRVYRDGDEFVGSPPSALVRSAFGLDR